MKISCRIVFISTVLLLISICSTPAASQSSVQIHGNCDIEQVRLCDLHAETVSSVQIRSFLLEIQPECINNVEFTEFSNVVLFKLLDVRTGEIIELLEFDEEINVGYILAFLRNPLHDEIPLQRIRDRVLLQASSDTSPMIIQILEALPE